MLSLLLFCVGSAHNYFILMNSPLFVKLNSPLPSERLTLPLIKNTVLGDSKNQPKVYLEILVKVIFTKGYKE